MLHMVPVIRGPLKFPHTMMIACTRANTDIGAGNRHPRSAGLPSCCWVFHSVLKTSKSRDECG